MSEYGYDHEGQRVKKVEYAADGSNETTYYVGKDFVRMVNSSGIFDTTYYYHDDVLVARKDWDGKKYFYHPDHLGSTTLVTNEAGEVVERIGYLPFGGTFGEEANSRFLHAGKEKDKDTGLYYYPGRYYDPDMARFIQPDPTLPDVYDPQSLNRYTYVENNPYRYVDPDGKKRQEFFLNAPATTYNLLKGFGLGSKYIGLGGEAMVHGEIKTGLEYAGRGVVEMAKSTGKSFEIFFIGPEASYEGIDYENINLLPSEKDLLPQVGKESKIIEKVYETKYKGYEQKQQELYKMIYPERTIEKLQGGDGKGSETSANAYIVTKKSGEKVLRTHYGGGEHKDIPAPKDTRDWA